ncbi:helix-turn-helix domain-containing protein [Gordonia sp. 852002-51296_SCH5728562-b]|uniref:helix-turn-helix domain-containing protein n=1 Tax=Gordonia sp. 852002-51296_SCH5728562-b TaxID=1834101 RepID=UPI0009ECF748
MHFGALHFSAPTASVGEVPRLNSDLPPRVPRPDLRALGWAVKQARESLGWSIDRLAEETEVSRRTILTVEAGQKSPNIRTLHALAHGLGVPVSELVDHVCDGHEPPSGASVAT